MAIDIKPPKKDTGRVGLDNLPTVTRDEALEHMIHHLQLATIYYQNTSDNSEEVHSELERLMLRDCPEGYQPPELIAARSWIAALDIHFEQLKREQGD